MSESVSQSVSQSVSHFPLIFSEGGGQFFSFSSSPPHKNQMVHPLLEDEAVSAERRFTHFTTHWHGAVAYGRASQIKFVLSWHTLTSARSHGFANEIGFISSPFGIIKSTRIHVD